uniref:Uncharacterized protein n=1 Tax=Cacopsylla melanoneura TaxID=428564 RepID=A0A8D8XJX0_9HEMI
MLKFMLYNKILASELVHLGFNNAQNNNNAQNQYYNNNNQNNNAKDIATKSDRLAYQVTSEKHLFASARSVVDQLITLLHKDKMRAVQDLVIKQVMMVAQDKIQVPKTHKIWCVSTATRMFATGPKLWCDMLKSVHWSRETPTRSLNTSALSANITLTTKLTLPIIFESTQETDRLNVNYASTHLRSDLLS